MKHRENALWLVGGAKVRIESLERELSESVARAIVRHHSTTSRIR